MLEGRICNHVIRPPEAQAREDDVALAATVLCYANTRMSCVMQGRMR